MLVTNVTKIRSFIDIIYTTQIVYDLDTHSLFTTHVNNEYVIGPATQKRRRHDWMLITLQNRYTRWILLTIKAFIRMYKWIMLPKNR